jgi:hypothetical protein
MFTQKQKEATHAQINLQNGRTNETNKAKKYKADRTKKPIKPRNKRGEYHYITNMDSM